MKKFKIIKPKERNFLVVKALLRSGAGSHQKTNKQQRQKENTALRTKQWSYLISTQIQVQSNKIIVNPIPQ